MTGAVDNDVLFKAACYGLLRELGGYVDASLSRVGVLGAAPFVVRRLVARATLLGDREAVLAHLNQFLSAVVALEPDPAEQELAADLELVAQLRGLPLHAGESQLCAMAVRRGLTSIVTGDKGAITALERLLDDAATLTPLCGRVHCLEQAVLSMCGRLGDHTVRSAVCSEPHVDIALSMCFSCFSTDPDPTQFAAGLRSYIDSLRAGAARILAA